MIEDAVVDMTYEAVKQADVRKRIAKTLAGYEAERATEEKPERYFIKKEIRRIDTAFERIWQAIEDGIAPPVERAYNRAEAPESGIRSPLARCRAIGSTRTIG